MRMLTILLVFGYGLTLGCSKDSNDNSPTRTVNHAPVIQSVAANPPTINAGERSILTCVATDEDRDTLVYIWDYSQGTIYDYYDNGRRASWYSPNTQGHYFVRVTVNDGIAIGVDSVSVQVN